MVTIMVDVERGSAGSMATTGAVGRLLSTSMAEGRSNQGVYSPSVSVTVTRRSYTPTVASSSITNSARQLPSLKVRSLMRWDAQAEVPFNLCSTMTSSSPGRSYSSETLTQRGIRSPRYPSSAPSPTSWIWGGTLSRRVQLSHRSAR